MYCLRTHHPLFSPKTLYLFTLPTQEPIASDELARYVTIRLYSGPSSHSPNTMKTKYNSDKNGALSDPFWESGLSGNITVKLVGSGQSQGSSLNVLPCILYVWNWYALRHQWKFSPRCIMFTFQTICPRILDLGCQVSVKPSKGRLVIFIG